MLALAKVKSQWVRCLSPHFLGIELSRLGVKKGVVLCSLEPWPEIGY